MRIWQRGGEMGCALLLMARVALAVEGFTWDFPRDFPRQPASFRLTYRSSNDPGGVLQQFGVPWHALTDCLGSAEPTRTTANRFCATLPTCLAPGTYTFWIAAIWPDAESKGEELVSCQADAQCQCTEVAQSTTPAPATPTPAPSPAPTPGPAPSPAAPPPAPTPPPVQVPQPIFQLPPAVPV